MFPPVASPVRALRASRPPGAPAAKSAYACSAAVVLAAVLAACTPALDWREVRAGDEAVSVLFPCRPRVATRSVPLAGQSVRMTLQACHAAGVTWALAVADLGDPTHVTPALHELRRTAALNLGARVDGEVSRLPLEVKGATPNAASMRVRLAGRMPDGRAAGEQVAVFAHGTRVFQATVLGERIDDAAADMFFASLRVGPA